MMRRYTGKWHRFVQPDPYDGSYDLTNPQSFNRYAYVQNDPVNFIDPNGLDPDCADEFNNTGRCTIGGDEGGTDPGPYIGDNGIVIVDNPETNPTNPGGGPVEPPQDPVPVPGPTPAPHVKPCDRNGVKYNQEELDDLAENLGGRITYTKPGKPDSEAVITNLKGRPTFSQFESRLRENNWNEIWFNMSPEHWGGEDWKRQGKYGNWYHITVYPKKLSHRLRTEAKNLWPPTKITIHCDNGNPQDPFHER